MEPPWRNLRELYLQTHEFIQFSSSGEDPGHIRASCMSEWQSDRQIYTPTHTLLLTHTHTHTHTQIEKKKRRGHTKRLVCDHWFVLHFSCSGTLKKKSSSSVSNYNPWNSGWWPARPEELMIGNPSEGQMGNSKRCVSTIHLWSDSFLCLCVGLWSLKICVVVC